MISVFLAKEFGVFVFAAEMRKDPTENYSRFVQLELENTIFPIRAGAEHLPFARESFDGIIRVDAYHYFDRITEFLDEKIVSFLKENGWLVLAFPGCKKIFRIRLQFFFCPGRQRI